MNELCLLSLLACIFSIHSAKPETNQRHSSEPADQTNSSSDEKKRSKKRLSGRKPSQQKEAPQFIATPPTATEAQPNVTIQPLFANRLNREQKRINLFVTKIDFSRDGVSLFLNHTFNNKEYGSEFLPYSMTHLVQFLEFAHVHQQSPEFIEGALRLFIQKYKGAPFVTAPALERFLEKASPYFEQHLATTQYSMWQSFKQTLSQTFREKFLLAKQDPLGFFEYVSKDLAAQVTNQITTPTRVRATLLRLLTHTTDKVIWSPSDQEYTWQSFKKLGEAFHILHTKQVIPDELDANELYWGLVERYCYFLKLAGTQLNLETCKVIKKDLMENSPIWLRHKEQETVLETKMERLMVTIMETEAKLHAKDHGIITDILPHQRT